MLTYTKDMVEEQEAADKEYADNPMVQRRVAVEREFLCELTKLSRRYGLKITADERRSYGESYPEFVIEAISEGTESCYGLSDYRGVDFDADVDGDNPVCSPDERQVFEAQKALRDAEDRVIENLSRKRAEISWRNFEKAHNLSMQSLVTDMQEREPPKPSCRCGLEFESQDDLAAHVAETGHKPAA